MSTKAEARKKQNNKVEAAETLARTGRPPIPGPMKREVRRRCGFGCVVCGFPLYEYEHMEEWAIVKRHVASEITLLCDRHHREKTNGLLGIQQVRDANANPINLRGTSTPYPFHVQPETLIVRVGENVFSYAGTARHEGMIVFSIDGEPILWFTFDRGNLLLNLSIYGESDALIAKIRDNELVYSTEVWDVTLIGRTLTIQAAARDTMLALTVSPNDNMISIDRAKLRYKGFEVFVDDKGIRMLNGPRFAECIFEGSGHLINFGGRRNTGAAIHGGPDTPLESACDSTDYPDGTL